MPFTSDYLELSYQAADKETSKSLNKKVTDNYNIFATSTS